MIPAGADSVLQWQSVPRVGGGDPVDVPVDTNTVECSPRRWG